MRVERLTAAADLARVAPAWQDLFGRLPELPPFVSPAWLLPWWQVFAPGRLAGVAVWQGRDLVALAPLYVEDGVFGQRLLPLGIGISDSLDVLLDPTADAGALLVEAIGADRDWSLWSAEEARPGAAVLSLPDPAGFVSSRTPQSACPTLALPGAAGSLESAVPAGQRRKLRMAQHRAARRDTRLRRATVDTLADDLGHLIRLHGARWRSRGEAGVLADPVLERFHRTAAPGLFAGGLLDLMTLTIDGTVAGAYYGLRRGAAAYAYLGGFDPDYAFESPGTLLLGAAIERAWQGDAEVFHFLRGQEPYKYAWGARDRMTMRRTFEPL